MSDRVIAHVQCSVNHTVHRITNIVFLLAVTLLFFSATSVAVADTPETVAPQVSANNTTVQHERPSNVSQPGDSRQVSQWLQQRLQSRLEGSAINISQGQYERASGALGSEYDSRFEQFVNVAGETDGSSDNQVAQTFNETQTEQNELANARSSYRDTYEDYQQAREDGNTSETRTLARELQNTSDRIETLNRSLTQNYATLENQTGIEAETGQTAIANVTRGLVRQQATVRNQTFVETALTVQTNRTAVAFDAPLMITGQIETVNGTAITNRTIPLTIADRTYRPRTDSTGRFTISYRPVGLSTNATTATVAYRPTGTSPYVGTTTAVAVNVTQVTPTLSATASPTSGGYGTTISTSVTVSVDGQPVPEAPVMSTLGSRTATETTNTAGQTTLRQSVPATLLTGEQPITVTQTRDAAAVGPATTTTNISVTETETDLTVTTTSTETRMTIRGRLTTEDGVGVGNQEITIEAGQTDRLAVTNETGWYRISVSNVSQVGDENTSVSVISRFDAAGMNLLSSAATTTATLPSSDISEGENSLLTSGSELRLLIFISGCVVLLLCGALLVIYWRRSGNTRASGPSSTSTDSIESQATTESSASESLFTTAQAALDAGDLTRATVASYGAVRDRISARGDLPTDLTHREFLEAADSYLDATESKAVSTLADAYERVMYAGTVDMEIANDAVSAASSFNSETDDR